MDSHLNSSRIPLMIARQDKAFFRTLFLPSFLILLFLSVYATFGVVGLSFTNFNLQRPRDWGFTTSNYTELIDNGRFWHSIWISFFWSVSTSLSSMVVGTGLAIFMFRRFSNKVEYSVTFFFVLPFLLSKVGVAQIWKLLYRPFDLLNYGLSLINIAPVGFLSDPKIAFTAVAAVDVWQWSFMIAFLVLTLLNGIPHNYMEEADIIGVSFLRRHWSLTLPMIKTGLVSIFLLKFIESLRSFDLIYNLTRGGPGVRTETFDLYTYYRGIVVSGKIGSSAAMSIIMLAITIFLLVFLWNSLKERRFDI